MTVYDGDIYVSDQVISFASDRRLKTEFTPISDALQKVRKVNGMYFRWVQDEPSGIMFDKERHVGLIAQEVQEVLPEAVTSLHSGKYLGVDYPSLVPLIVEAVHELDDLVRAGTLTEEQGYNMTMLLLEQLSLRADQWEARADDVEARADKLEAELRTLLKA
ncbi:chaperone of endosialidase-domain-containing protein [Ochromonadaceae sp. CCMP2298]|nr:chaperone of endosialidase-domain-containing protein [Ochromonadaceae sp. CCMP2298]